MNGGNWSGSTRQDSDITYDVNVTSSPAKDYSVTFKVNSGGNGTQAATKLVKEWNKNYPDGPLASRAGNSVGIDGKVNNMRINGEVIAADGNAKHIKDGHGLTITRDAAYSDAIIGSEVGQADSALNQ